MTDNEKLKYLMKYAKKTLTDADEFIILLGENHVNTRYWEGRKFSAEMNIKILQSLGVSAKDEN